MSPSRPSRRMFLSSLGGVGLLATASCLRALRSPEEGEITAPDRTLVGAPPGVRLAGFPPQRSVTLECRATDAGGRRYEASWRLDTDRRGTATLSDAGRKNREPDSSWYGPARGRHVGNRSFGRMILHWLSATAPDESPANFVVGDERAIELTVRAGTGRFAGSSVRHRQERVYLDPAVSRRAIRTPRLRGWLYTPATSGPHPGVVTLHGAHAAVPHRLSELLATHGYATLALQYFDAPGLPATFERIPVEYFVRAVRWLTDRPTVRPDAVGLVGVSRGVEAALLTAARYDGRTSVVGYAGGGVIRHGVVGVPPREYSDHAAWTYEGTPVAPTSAIDRVFDVVAGVDQRSCSVDAALESVYTQLSQSTLEDVLVPVERIEGPVLLLAGLDDQQWPSATVAALTVDRLRGRDGSAPFGLKTYCEAGHVFGVPYADYSGAPTSAANGGTPAANAAAAADSWPLVLDYLEYGAQD